MTAKSKTSVALVKGDVEIPGVLNLLEKEMAKLKTISESVYRTSGVLPDFGDIKTEVKTENLIRAFSVVMLKEKAYNEAAKALNLTTFPQFQIGGFTTKDWKEDIMLRIDIITHKDKLDKLTEYKEKATKLMSVEDQKAMLFKEMQDYLTSQK